MSMIDNQTCMHSMLIIQALINVDVQIWNLSTSWSSVVILFHLQTLILHMYCSLALFG